LTKAASLDSDVPLSRYADFPYCSLMRCCQNCTSDVPRHTGFQVDLADRLANLHNGQSQGLGVNSAGQMPSYNHVTSGLSFSTT